MSHRRPGRRKRLRLTTGRTGQVLNKRRQESQDGLVLSIPGGSVILSVPTPRAETLFTLGAPGRTILSRRSVHQRTGQTRRPVGDGPVEVERSTTVLDNGSSVVDGVFELVGSGVRVDVPRVVGEVDDQWLVGLVASEKDGTLVQPIIDEPSGGRDGRHNVGNVISFGLLQRLLIGRPQTAPIGPRVGSIRRVIHGDDDIDLTLRNKEGLERNVLISLASINQGDVVKRRDRVGIALPRVEGVGVGSNVVVLLADFSENATWGGEGDEHQRHALAITEGSPPINSPLNSIDDQTIRIRLVQSQKRLVEQGRRSTGDESAKRRPPSATHFPRLVISPFLPTHPRLLNPLTQSPLSTGCPLAKADPKYSTFVNPP